MARPDSAVANPNSGQVMSVVVLVASMVILLWVLPVAYQTPDDPLFAQVFQGDRNIGLAPDAHCNVVHFLIGAVVSGLSSWRPEVAWYGYLMACLYILAFTIIALHLPGIADWSSPLRVVAVMFVYVSAYALFPLLLFQFTVVSGLLALAGMLPLVTSNCLCERVSWAMWVTAGVCFLFGSLIRFQMAPAIVICFLPTLVVSILVNRDWRQARKGLAYLTTLGAMSLALHMLDIYVDRGSEDRLRFREFNRLRSQIADRVAFEHGVPSRASIMEPAASGVDGEWPPSVRRDGLPAALSTNDYAMLRMYMGIDSGPFTLENLREAVSKGYARDSAGSSRGSGTTRSAPPEDVHEIRAVGSTRHKLEGILRGQSTRHVRLVLFLAGVIGGGCALFLITCIFKNWRAAAHLGAAALGSGAMCALSVFALDRAVFRVLFPCASVFLITSFMLFPWRQLGSHRALSPWRQLATLALLSTVALAVVVGVILGVTQICINQEKRSLHAEMMRRLQFEFGADRTIVAWPGTLKFQDQSPFQRGDDYELEVYTVDHTSSQPQFLTRLMKRFGSDVYAGVTGREVVHLATSDQVDVLRVFHAEHYGSRLDAIPLASFEIGQRDVSAWLLLEEPVEDPE